MHIPIGDIPDADQHVVDRQEGRLPGSAAVWPALIAITLVIAACGSENAAGDDSPLQATSQASIHFPQRTEDRDDNDGELIGELVLDGRCLYVESNVPVPIPSDVDTRFLIVWPHNAELRVSNGAIEIHDGTSQAVLRVGDEVRVGGGGSESVRSGLVLDACHGPYWIAAPGITRFDPVEATQEARSTPSLGIFLHRQEPEDRTGIDPGVLTGPLVEVDDCFRVNTEEGNSYLIVWPPNYSLDGEFRVFDAEGRLVVRVGEEVRLAGGEKETLGRNLPGRCPGPFWIVEDEADTTQATAESELVHLQTWEGNRLYMRQHRHHDF